MKSIMSAAAVVATVVLAAPVSAASPSSIADARKAFNNALATKNVNALAALVHPERAVVVRQFGDSKKLTRAQIKNLGAKAFGIITDPIPASATCKKSRCSWKEPDYCPHGRAARFKIVFKRDKSSKTLTLASISGKCK